MENLTAREIVVEAGKKLVETGLIARTWGNVSCRVGPEQFVITPSGRAYETLTPTDIVTVNTSDCSYDGELEPSSEKGVHAEVYRQRPDINFVIHTHQPYASAVSPLKLDINIEDPAVKALIGGKVVSITYGLPGSKTLRKNVAETLSESESKAFLLVSHGALCLGEDNDEAFRVAAELEKVCADFIDYRYKKISGLDIIDPVEFSDYFVARYTGNSKTVTALCPRNYCNSKRTDDGFRLYLNAAQSDPFPEDDADILEVNLKNIAAKADKTLSSAAMIHHEIYRRYAQINAIIHTTAYDIITVSRISKTIYPLLDDFAQIIGVNVKNVRIKNFEDPVNAAKKTARKIKRRHAVLLESNGALCCGPTDADAAAAAMILEKNCRALIAVSLFNRGKPLNSIECRLMRYIYLKRYSQKALAEPAGL